MEFIHVKDDLPANGSYVLARIGKGHPMLCQYKNDSFGFGDDDMWISSWAYLLPSVKHSPACRLENPLSTLLTGHHTGLGSSELLRNLGT